MNELSASDLARFSWPWHAATSVDGDGTVEIVNSVGNVVCRFEGNQFDADFVLRACADYVRRAERERSDREAKT